VQMRSAILAVGSHIFFQLSSSDADKIAAALDGGKTLAALLKTFPKRHMVLKIGSERSRQAVVPDLHQSEMNIHVVTTDPASGGRDAG